MDSNDRTNGYNNIASLLRRFGKEQDFTLMDMLIHSNQIIVLIIHMFEISPDMMRQKFNGLKKNECVTSDENLESHIIYIGFLIKMFYSRKYPENDEKEEKS